MDIEKNIGISVLLDLYGAMLTEKQRETVELYYNEDLSLSEIAQITGLSRAGVRDRLVKSEAILLSFEDKLRLRQRQIQQDKVIESVIFRLSEAKEGMPLPTDELIADLDGLISQ